MKSAVRFAHSYLDLPTLAQQLAQRVYWKDPAGVSHHLDAPAVWDDGDPAWQEFARVLEVMLKVTAC